ncbi:hypothetical protein JOQ06_003201 [Pogonophryne albipinna]|uniref:Uncharacterized protein n=1 Tax=Pogonophryne albipinna TaxID=1090488 RepID=A0AAD6B862_9TELE|nr:hypothetical protein JOQ06_003201 [Pogonophryne albipinna]
MDVEDSMVAVVLRRSSINMGSSFKQKQPEHGAHYKARLPAASAHLPQKRKQTSVARPSKPADLPPVSNVAPSPQTSTAPMHLEDPQRIRSVEDFQPIYHRAVEAMLSLVLGRPIKQKLWEQLDRPMDTETVDEDGLSVSCGAGVLRSTTWMFRVPKPTCTSKKS